MVDEVYQILFDGDQLIVLAELKCAILICHLLETELNSVAIR